MRYTLTRWFLSLPGSWLLRMSGQPQMTASGGRVFDPAGQFVVVSALKQGIFALDDTKTAAELRAIWKKQMKPFEKRLPEESFAKIGPSAWMVVRLSSQNFGPRRLSQAAPQLSISTEEGNRRYKSKIFQLFILKPYQKIN